MEGRDYARRPNELPALNGARVLVVQNDPFIAADVDLMIDDAGGKVVALAASRDDALLPARSEPIDAAVVDPNFGDGEAASLIQALNRRDIPFVIYPPSTSAQARRRNVTMGVRDCRCARHRSEADALLSNKRSSCSDAFIASFRDWFTPPARVACSVPAPARLRLLSGPRTTAFSGLAIFSETRPVRR